MQLYIKNMVCHRCKLMVQKVLETHGIEPLQISLGEVTIAETPSVAQLHNISSDLEKVGFELMSDQKSRLIEKIKTFIIEAIHYNDQQPSLKFSVLISQHVGHDYSFLSKLFSEVENITIEHFIIQQKIEKVKELIRYDEKSLSQIAFDLSYSSTAHLSAQFKKVTGMTPSEFKKRGVDTRKSLDEINSGGNV